LDSIHISDEQSTLSVPNEKSSDKLSDIEKQLTAGLSPLEIEEIQQTCKLVRKRHYADFKQVQVKEVTLKVA